MKRDELLKQRLLLNLEELQQRIKYNEIWKVIYQHTSQVIPDFTLTEETIKDVLVQTLNCYEKSLLNARQEINILNNLIQEKEQMIQSLIQTNIHIKTLGRSDKDE